MWSCAATTLWAYIVIKNFTIFQWVRLPTFEHFLGAAAAAPDEPRCYSSIWCMHTHVCNEQLIGRTLFPIQNQVHLKTWPSLSCLAVPSQRSGWSQLMMEGMQPSPTPSPCRGDLVQQQGHCHLWGLPLLDWRLLTRTLRQLLQLTVQGSHHMLQALFPFKVTQCITKELRLSDSWYLL